MARNLGLDTARAAAIVLVLITHGSTFFFWDHYDVLAFSYVTGYYGVEIFFVLSGFLIGNILLGEIVENGSWKALGRFYMRRWMRTLPLYFFILLVTWLFIGRQFHWYNLVFIQNFNEQALGFMPVSWSLTIEEWFYLLIPFLLLVLCTTTGRQELFVVKYRAGLVIAVCVWIMIGELFYRLIYVLAENPLWDYGVRKHIPMRLDSLVVGVLLAAIRRYRPWGYERLRSPVACVAALAALALCGVFVYRHIESGTMDQSLFARTMLFTVVSMAFAVCIAALEGNKRLQSLSSRSGSGSVVKSIKFLSVTSYAAYLTHWEIFIYYQSLIEKPSVATCFGLTFFALFLTFSASFLLHKLIEKPFMDMRERLPVFLGGSTGGEGRGKGRDVGTGVGSAGYK